MQCYGECPPGKCLDENGTTKLTEQWRAVRT